MKYLKIPSGVFMLIILIAYCNRNKLNDSLACSKASEFKRAEYSGTVLKKIIDQKNHRFRTIAFKQEVRDIVLTVDTSQFYAFVDTGDSIVKKRNNDYLSLIRASKVYTFKIYFECPK